MKLNVIVSGFQWYHSFHYCGLVFKEYFPCELSIGYRKGFLNILIYDLFHTVKWQKQCEIAWLDTPLNMESLIQPLRLGTIKPRWQKLYVTCQQNKEEAERVGLNVDDVVYRIASHEAFKYEPCEKKRDFVTISAYYPDDRKNLRLINNVVEKLRLDFEALTSAPFVKRKIRHGIMDDRAKFKWLRESRFLIHVPFTGSFEMPVYEAMACGVVPIYSEIPCLKEYAVGIPVKVGEVETITTVDGKMYKWSVEQKDVEEAVKYALGLSRDAYEDLSIKAREKARAMNNETVKKWREVLNDLPDFSDFSCDFI